MLPYLLPLTCSVLPSFLLFSFPFRHLPHRICTLSFPSFRSFPRSYFPSHSSSLRFLSSSYTLPSGYLHRSSLPISTPLSPHLLFCSFLMPAFFAFHPSPLAFSKFLLFGVLPFSLRASAPIFHIGSTPRICTKTTHGSHQGSATRGRHQGSKPGVTIHPMGQNQG